MVELKHGTWSAESKFLNEWWRVFIIILGPGSRQITFTAIDWTRRSGDWRDNRHCDSRQIWFCSSLVLQILVKRVVSMPKDSESLNVCFLGGLLGAGSLVSNKFYEPRFIVILRSKLRQIQVWSCGYLLGRLLSTLRCYCGYLLGVLVHWRLCICGGSCLTLTGGLIWCFAIRFSEGWVFCPQWVSLIRVGVRLPSESA